MRIRPGIIIGIIVLLVLAIAGQWFFFKSQFEKTLPQLEARAQDAGLRLDYDSVHIGGFPFRVEAHYGGLKISKDSPLLSFAIEAPKAVLIRQLWRKDLSLFYFEAPRFAAALQSPLPRDQSGELTLVWQASAMQTSLRSEGPGLVRLSSVIEQAEGRSNALSMGDFVASQLQFHLNWPQLGAPETLLNVALRFTDLQLDDAEPITSGYVGFGIEGASFEPLSPAGLGAWQAAEGDVRLDVFELDWGDFRAVQGTGRFALEPDLHIGGKAKIDILGLPALTYRLDQSDILNPELEDITLITLRLMLAGATSETPVPVEVSIDNGMVRVGPTPLVKLGPVVKSSP